MGVPDENCSFNDEIRCNYLSPGGTDETDCGFAGCCPEPNWICCPDPDPTNCAATWEDCPFEARRIKLVKLAKDNQCGPDDTECPFGCCPNPYTYCCPDMDCTTSAEWCP